MEPPKPPAQERIRMDFTDAQVNRYARHILLDEIGGAGQAKLLAARVLVIGAGGLGSPVLLYLAAAGVGTIGVIDDDVVDLSNLQRQIVHTTDRLGMPKVESARAALAAINPEVRVVPHGERLTADNARSLIAGYDVIADGSDNFPTRFRVNDACFFAGKPLVSAAILRFDGQLATFRAGVPAAAGCEPGPCYRCLYPEPPPPGLVPSCAEGGVLGVLPGIIGCIQANETLKLILGIGEPLIGRFLVFDALRMKFRELKLRKDPDCPVCGTHPTVTELIDYEQFCGMPAVEAEPVAQPQAGSDTANTDITVLELKARRDTGEDLFVLDVREPHEYQINRIEGSTLIPLGDLPDRFTELDPNREIVAQCKSGMRSARAAAFLRDQGFKNVRNLKGGILAWIDQVDPSQMKY